MLSEYTCICNCIKMIASKYIKLILTFISEEEKIRYGVGPSNIPIIYISDYIKTNKTGMTKL